MHRDIFKDVVDLVCCNYISDLRFLVKEVYQKIHKINFKEYDICELQKFFHMFLYKKYLIMKI